MKKIGEELKKIREEKELTIKDVYVATKIHPSIIGSVEDGTIEQKMDSIYVRGFLKTYARFLGLDPNTIIEKASKTRSKTKTKVKEEPSVIEYEPKGEGEKKEKPKKSFSVSIDYAQIVKPYLKPAGFLILSIIAAFILVQITTSFVGYVQESFAKRRAQKRITIKPVESPARNQRFTQADAVEKSSQKTSSPAKAEPKAKTGLFAKTEVKAPPASVAAEGPVTLKVSTVDDVWMRVKADGNTVFQEILSKGQSEIWKADENVELWVGKAEAMRMNVNGKDLGSPGDGVIRNINVKSSGVYVNDKLVKGT